jgi:poly[(R)-3-hydroxyalkanoate] polymerase subunit PhaC
MAGLGPVESTFRVAFREPGVTLRHYEGRKNSGPVVLIVPAPIKRSYIWDLLPWASVVALCIRSGLQVYLANWERSGIHEQNFGLAEYADRLLLDCLDVIDDDTGNSKIFLSGHSLGGTLAAIFSSLHPTRVTGLALIGSPLHFGKNVGAIDSLIAASPRAQMLTTLAGNLPGSFLSEASFAAAPLTFGTCRWIDWVASLKDPQSIQTHLRVERWTLDEMPMARRLFEEVFELLYREDRFCKGTLDVGGKVAAPEFIGAPLLSVIDARCSLIPPQAVLPFHDAVSSPDTKILWYQGDTGVALQHVGMLVGKQARKILWPKIINWMQDHWETG